MSVMRRYENILSQKVKQKDMFNLLRNWITSETSVEATASFAENILKSGRFVLKTNNKNFEIQTIHFGNKDITAYEDNYLISSIIIDEDRNLYIDNKGVLIFNKKEENWVCSIKSETLKNNQSADINFDGFDFTPSFLKYCQTQKKLGENIGFRLTNRPIHLRWEDYEEVKHLLKDDVIFYKPISLIRITDETLLKKATEELKIETAVWIDDDPDLFDDLKDDGELDCSKIPNENSISYYPPFGYSKTYLLDENSDLNTIIKDIKQRVDEYHIENCMLRADYEKGLIWRRASELDCYHTIIDDLKQENAGLKKDIGELKILSKQKLPVSVGSIAKTKNTVNVSKEPLIFNGDNKELYDGEIKDMVRSSLEEYREKYVQDGTRRADVLDSILKENKSTGICNKKATEISSALKDYDGASPKNIATLEKLGFKVKSKSKHLKIQWYDPRYTYSIATTPSDINAAENIIHSIIKMCL